MENADSINLCYQIVRGLRTKTHSFYISTDSCDYDVIFLSETRLIPSIYDSELFNANYIDLRFDKRRVVFACCLYIPYGSDDIVYAFHFNVLKLFFDRTKCKQTDTVLVLIYFAVC